MSGGKVKEKGWLLEEEIPEETKKKWEDFEKQSFSYYGLDLLDTCEPAAKGSPHYPHEKTDSKRRKRFCFGRGGLVDGQKITIVVTERPKHLLLEGPAKCYVVKEPLKSILDYQKEQDSCE